MNRRFGRTFAGAEAAGLLVLDGDTEVACPDSMTDLYGCALLDCDRLYGRGWADLRAAGALGTAVAALVAYLRLHEAIQAAAWAQHVVGAGIDAELAGRAVRAKIADGE